MLQQLRAKIDEKRATLSVKQALKRAPARIWRGTPSTLLAVMLNTLDATSTGLLVFPPASVSPAFETLQAPAMSIYVMSTMISQLTLTLGGSGFPGALGRGAREEQSKAGPHGRNGLRFDEFPDWFLLLGIGTATIGMDGRLTIPPRAPELTLATVNEVLITKDHIALLLATVVPTVALCITLRVRYLAKITGGFTEHAMYVPCFMLMTVAIFWTVVAATGQANQSGMASLASKGWLFTVTGPMTHESGLGTAWNYFKLFDFSMVEWSAMKAGIGNIVLLVVIGVLNLPIYVPAMGLILKQPNISMNWELIGHGISNILSGCAGSLPNLIVLSNSRLFTFAGGGRFEGFATAFLSLVTFFCSGRLLPYVPTIVAAILVCFLGLDLMIESLWIPARELVWSEWLIALGTTMACTWIGFLQGFAIGFGAAVFQYCLWNFYDMRASRISIAINSNDQASRPGKKLSMPVLSPKQNMRDGSPTSDGDEMSVTTLMSVIHTSTSSVEERHTSTAEVVSVYGHVFFGIIPSLEQKIVVAFRSGPTTQVIIDFSNAWRCETCIGQMIRQKLDEYRSDLRPRPFIFTGIPADSVLALDLGRGGVSCVWPQMGPTDMEFDDAVECYFDLYDGISASQSGGSDQWLGRPFFDPKIGDILKDQNATIYELGQGEFLDLQALRGTVKVNTFSSSPLTSDTVLDPGEKEHVARLPLAIAIKMCALKTFMTCRRALWTSRRNGNDWRSSIDEEKSAAEQFISLRGGTHTLRSGDTYWPETDFLYQRGKQYTERLSAIGEDCKVLALPIEGPSVDNDATRKLLQSLETQSMYRRTLSRAVWKF
ncbi:hypothetical protein KEM54_006171 [Ascosphaera aggregata]|nr:hypothetical protein KEM54_006171 [Ascosphaera aggregata]